jgi:hypothetical protein
LARQREFNMGQKAIIPALIGGAAIAASGGLATPLVAGEAAAGGGAGAAGLLGTTATGAAASAVAPTVAAETAGNFMTPYAAETLGGMQAVPTMTAEVAPATGLVNTAATEGGLGGANSSAIANGTWDTRLANLKDFAGKYGTVDNTIGAAKLMAAMPANTNKPPQSSATVKAASQMQQAQTAGLLESYGDPSQYTPKKQRFTLLG